MNIINAQYLTDVETGEVTVVKANIDGVDISVPMQVGNRHYDEIMRQVDAGTLTIAEAE